METDYIAKIIGFYRKEATKIPLKCEHPTCLFDITNIHIEATKKLYAKWKAECPHICPKWREEEFDKSNTKNTNPDE